MIAMLRGEVVEVSADGAIIDCNGVGYEAHCSISTLSELQAKLGKPVQLFAYTHVREDALQIFGFATRTEKELFLSLLKVNGVGPKLALNVLSGATPEHFAQMIEDEDVKALSKLPKVGKKTAEQMILTLKGKLVFGVGSAPATGAAVNTKTAALTEDARQIYSALINLGYKNVDVEKLLATFPKDIGFEEGVRLGLQAFSGGL